MKSKSKARTKRAFVRVGENLPALYLRSLQVYGCISQTGLKGLTVEWIEANTPPHDRNECAAIIATLVDQKMIVMLCRREIIEGTTITDPKDYPHLRFVATSWMRGEWVNLPRG